MLVHDFSMARAASGVGIPPEAAGLAEGAAVAGAAELAVLVLVEVLHAPSASNASPPPSAAHRLLRSRMPFI
jgi:hypothetical protein